MERNNVCHLSRSTLNRKQNGDTEPLGAFEQGSVVDHVHLIGVRNGTACRAPVFMAHLAPCQPRCMLPREDSRNLWESLKLLVGMSEKLLALERSGCRLIELMLLSLIWFCGKSQSRRKRGGGS